MAFSEIELKKIEKIVGALCDKRSPPHLKDRLSLTYSVKGHEVIIVERHPRRDRPEEWTELPVAKLKYTRTANQWQLYWQRANMRWVSYEPRSESRDLAELVDQIDEDPFGCFFG